MKEYNLIPQERNNYCACAILQAIFKKYKIEISQEEVANNLNPSEKGFYIDDKKFRIFIEAQNFEYNYYFYNQTPFNEPDMLIQTMYEHNGFIGFNNHLYLLLDFKDPKITIQDPANSKIIKKELSSLLKNKPFFGLIKKI